MSAVTLQQNRNFMQIISIYNILQMKLICPIGNNNMIKNEKVLLKVMLKFNEYETSEQYFFMNMNINYSNFILYIG